LNREGSPQKGVANLWREFAAQRRYWLLAHVKEPQNPNKLVMAELSKRQKLSFLPNCDFGTERSEVRILSPERGLREPSLLEMLAFSRMSGVGVEISIDDKMSLAKKRS